MFLNEFCDARLKLQPGTLTVGQMLDTFRSLGISVPSDAAAYWEQQGLEDFDPDRIATRLEAAVLLDALFHPFENYSVDFNGHLHEL